MNSKTMLTPALDGEALERVEAGFLRGEISLRGFRPEALLPVTKIPPLGTDRPAGVDYEALRPTVRTSRRGCC
jgi:hypothetical protein